MSAGFTPGPWEAVPNSEGSWSICTTDGSVIAGVYDYAHEFSPEDARLIAAAPELYEALEELRRLVADIKAVERNPRFLDANGKALRTLAKARGES